jgi:hypothetical protein
VSVVRLRPGPPRIPTQNAVPCRSAFLFPAQDVDADRSLSVGIGKAETNQFQNTAHDHRILVAKWTPSRTQNRRHQAARLAVENHQRQLAGRTLVVVVERRRLLAGARIFGVIRSSMKLFGALAQPTMNCATGASLPR